MGKGTRRITVGNQTLPKTKEKELYNMGAYEIMEMFSHLSLDEKKEVIKDLQKMIEVQENEPAHSFLEENWIEIENLMYELSREPYIDDQLEIDEIWNLCDDMIKSGKLQKETWQVRKRIIELIIENEYYDYYSVYDPMHDLMETLLFNEEEAMWCAECMESSSKYMQAEAAKIYKKFGRDDKYYKYLESTLSKDSKPYLELAEYYLKMNERKAIEIAELGREKCNDRALTGIYIFLVKAYKDKDNEYIQKLVKSAKARQMVDEKAVLAAMTEQMV